MNGRVGMNYSVVEEWPWLQW